MPIAQHKDGALLFFFLSRELVKIFAKYQIHTTRIRQFVQIFCYFATIIQQSIKLYDNKKCLINTVSKYGLKRFARKIFKYETATKSLDKKTPVHI